MDGSVDQRGIIKDALELLPERDRLILSLHYVDGLTSDGIAQVLRTTPEAAADAVVTARARLRARVSALVKDAKTRAFVMRFI